jgi:hypothetical protein
MRFKLLSNSVMCKAREMQSLIAENQMTRPNLSPFNLPAKSKGAVNDGSRLGTTLNRLFPDVADWRQVESGSVFDRGHCPGAISGATKQAGENH